MIYKYILATVQVDPVDGTKMALHYDVFNNLDSAIRRARHELRHVPWVVIEQNIVAQGDPNPKDNPSA